MKKLGGFGFIRCGVMYDYCFRESIECMLEFCDKVSIVYVESGDGTLDVLEDIKSKTDKLLLTYIKEEDWLAQHGKYKLSYFQNIALSKLDTDYQFLLQSDEILHESCYGSIRQAMKSDQEGYMVSRINLWGNPTMQLNVPQNRKPCSTEVIRLSKTGFLTYDDGESINAQCVDWFLKDIRIFHMGFVRDRKIHPLKIKEMQGNIFECGVDEKLNGMIEFDPTKWFDPEKDLKPIDEPLPKIIKEWADARM